MRSSPSKADPLDPGPAGFVHRGLHGAGVPENSLAAFEAALEIGTGIECDLRLTADDHVVVFHDADATRLCANPVRIGGSTWEDVAGLRIDGHPIPQLQDLLDVVAGRVPILLEIKVERDLRRWGRALTRELGGYVGALGIMSFHPRLPRLLKANLPHLRRGLVIRDSLPWAKRLMAIWLADPEFVAVDKIALRKSWVRRARKRIPVYSWTIRTPEQRAQAEVQADALIWEGDGRPRI